MKRFALVLMVLAFSGCVSSGKFDKVQDERDRSIEELNKTKKLLASEQQKYATAQDKLLEQLTVVSELEKKMGKTHIDNESLVASIQQMKKAMSDAEAREQEAKDRIEEFKELIKKFRKLIDAGQLTIRFVNGKMVVALASDILFPSGSAKLSKEGVDAIHQVAKKLASIPDREFQIEGHTDNDPIKTSQYPSNWELASARAITVLKAMVDSGVPAGRISAASFADTKPNGPNDTKESKAANRRIEIVVVPDLSKLPGYSELQEATKNK